MNEQTKESKMSNLQDIQKAIKEVMGKDPIEMAINYYKSLIQHDYDVIADCEKHIRELEEDIKRLKEQL